MGSNLYLYFWIMIYFFKKVIHFFLANSRHGTHSPFVYALADELVYNKNTVRRKTLIEDIICHYVSKGIARERFLITDFYASSVEDLLVLQDQYFMIFLKDIHKSAYASQWKVLTENESFIVLIDFFEFGIICKRKEQPKETFKLRYPYYKY